MTKLCIVGLLFFCCIVCSSVVSASGFTVSSDFGARVYVYAPDVVYVDSGFSSRLYIKPSIVPSFNITTRVFGGDVTVVPVLPVINVTSNYDAGTGDLTVSWDHGNNTDTVVLVMNNDSVPSDVGDGDVLYNNTGTSHSMSVPSHPFYLEVFAYNETCNEYSVGVSVPWGIFVNVYDENNPHVGLTFDLEVTNQDGSMVYVSSGCSNPEYVNESLCPHGDYVKLSVSADGYYASSQTFSIFEGEIKFINMYLSPKEGTGPGGPGGPCETRTYTDSRLVTDPDVDCVIPLSYTVKDIISVEVFNSSLYGSYGGWLFVTQNDYTLYVSNVTVDSRVLDSNSTMVRVSYYYEDCSGTVSYLYQFTVLEADQTEYGASATISNALVTIKRYINTSNSFVTVRNGYTDGNGQVDFYLVSYVNYKVFIEKDGYVSVVNDFTANPDNRFKTYRLERVSIEIPEYDPFSITLDAYWTTHPFFTGTDVLYVSYDDSNSSTIDWDIYIYEIYNNTERLVFSVSGTNNTYENYILATGNINKSRTYKVVCYYNNSAFFAPMYDGMLVKVVYGVSIDDDPFDVEERFSSIFGENPFLWTNIIAIALAVIVLVGLGPVNVAAALIGSGASLGLMALIFNKWFTNTFPAALITVSVVLIVLGVIYFWSKGQGGDNL